MQHHPQNFTRGKILVFLAQPYLCQSLTELNERNVKFVPSFTLREIRFRPSRMNEILLCPKPSSLSLGRTQVRMGNSTRSFLSIEKRSKEGQFPEMWFMDTEWERHTNSERDGPFPVILPKVKLVILFLFIHNSTRFGNSNVNSEKHMTFIVYVTIREVLFRNAYKADNFENIFFRYVSCSPVAVSFFKTFHLCEEVLGCHFHSTEVFGELARHPGHLELSPENSKAK